MNVAIRVDGSEDIGVGHVMRCLTLADNFKNQGITVFFISRALPDNLSDSINTSGFLNFNLELNSNSSAQNKDANSNTSWSNLLQEHDAEATLGIVTNLQQRLEWIVVDHYGLDRHWEKIIKRKIQNILVIDDLANRPHDCDLLLDQNYYKHLDNRYDHLVPENCRKMLGPSYALLREEFRLAFKKLKQRKGQIHRILVFLGGSDPQNQTTKVLEAIRMLENNRLQFDVVVGGIYNVPLFMWWCEDDVVIKKIPDKE